MKIGTRYQADKSAGQKGEGIMESSRGNTTENCNWILTLKTFFIVKHVLEGLAVLFEGEFVWEVLCIGTIQWLEEERKW